jgi:ubiquinone/menaquinone biosynthesis C-methylase UbiE
MAMGSYPRRPYEFDGVEFVSVYDELPLWSAMVGRILLEQIPLFENARLLDVGTGFPLLELAGRLGPSCRAWGIDPWKPACERAREKIKVHGIANVQIVEGDAAAMPFEDGQFNLIVSNVGINNFSDVPRVLSECRRVSSSGGILAMATNLQGHMREFYDVFESTLKEMGKVEWLDRLHAHIETRTTMASMERSLVDAGFKVIRKSETAVSMRFLDGSALLDHFFIRQAFLDSWRQIPDSADETRVLLVLERNLNLHAQKHGELKLSIPVGYIEGKKDQALGPSA